MPDQLSNYHHLRCEQLGSVTVAVAAQSAFAKSTHPADWTPHTDAVTNRELLDDLTTLAATSPGPVVLDLRAVEFVLGDAVYRLMRFAGHMTANGKAIAVCASPTLLEVLVVSGLTRRFPCSSELSVAIESVSPA